MGYSYLNSCNNMVARGSLLLMLLGSAVAFGYTYGLDIIQTLEVPLREEPFSLSTFQFNLLYFFTFIFIFLFNIPIGTLIDRHSLTFSMFALLATSLAAQLIGTLMLQFRPQGYLAILYVMRAFFGLAGEGIFTVQSRIVARYCRKEDFEFVLSMCLSLPFLFYALDSVVTTQLYDSTNAMSVPWYASTAVCLLSFLSGLAIFQIYIRGSSKANPLLEQEEEQDEVAEKSMLS
jgi:MFS family permease